MCAILALCAFLGLSTASTQNGASSSPGADLILYGGRIITLTDPEPQPAPTALVVVADRIVHVGDDTSALAYQEVHTEVIALQGAVVIPGFVDGHAHLYGLGKALAEVDLLGTRSPQEVVQRIVARAATLPATVWVQGRGWDQNDWELPEFPHRRLLDEVLLAQPVLLRRVDGHAAWANSAALSLAGITAETVDPDGGRIVRDGEGVPTGVLIDNAIDLVREHIPPPSREQIRSQVAAATARCLEFGITGVHEAGVTLAPLSVYQEMAAAGELQLRLYVMLADDEETLDAGLAAGAFTSPDGLLSVRAVKLYADGALGSRGALLLEDYSDDPGNRGLLVTGREHLREVAQRAGQAGFQVCTHAIGDGANRLVLDLYEEVMGQLALRDTRWRVEHAQILHPVDVPRFARLGVIASMQPVHCTSDMDWAGARLSAAREEGAYAWRTLLDTGARLCFGTDFPVEHVDPLAGLFAARTRTHPDGSPAGGWHPEQCLNGREALRLYSAGPAYASFQEDDLGAVRSGLLADLTVLSGDPVACRPAELLEMSTLLTIVGGKVRYDARR